MRDYSKRIYLSIFWIIVGAALFAAGSFGKIDSFWSGMGGALMVEILEGSPDVVETLDTLILQPQSAAPELRRWIYRKHWHIEDESLALDDGRIYEIIMAKRGRRKMPEQLMLEIGPVLWQKKPPLLRHHIEALLFQERRVAAGMEKSDAAKKSKKYQAVIRHIKELGEHLSW